MQTKDRIIIDQVGNVTLSLTPHKMATNKSGKQYRKSIGYWIVTIEGKDVAYYQDCKTEQAKKARAEFARAQQPGYKLPGWSK